MKIKLYKTITSYIIPGYITVILFLMLIFIYFIPRFERILIDGKKAVAREQVSTVISLLSLYQQKVMKGMLSEKEAKQHAIAVIKNLRYGEDKKGYFWINDMTPSMIMHPHRDKLEGVNLISFRDSQGTPVFKIIVQLCKKSGKGFVHYFWQNNGKDHPGISTTSYVELFVPWQWVVGSDIHMDKVTREIRRSVTFTIYISIVILVIITIIISVTTYKSFHMEQERDNALEEKEQTDDKVTSILETANEGFIMIDNEAIIIDANPETCSMLTISREELIGENIRKFIQPDDHERYNHQLAIRDQGIKSSYEITLVSPSGDNLTTLFNASPYYDNHGRKIGSFALITDITSEKKTRMEILASRENIKFTNDKLAREREKLAITLESINEAVITTSLTGTIELFNLSAEDLTGWKTEEARGVSIDDIIDTSPTKDFTNLADMINRAVIRGEAVRHNRHIVIRNRKGENRYCNISASPILDGYRKAYGAVCIIVDDTIRIKINEELIKANKIESLGVFAGGIAHDFNNLLTTVMGNISLVKNRYHKNRDLVDTMNNIEKASSTIQSLSQQLLTFSRGGDPIKKVHHMRKLITEAVSMSMSGTGINYSMDIPEVSNCKVDKGQLQQVLHNLVINAQQAINDNGTIEITAANRTVKPDDSVRLPAGEYVAISIKDNGAGVPKDILSNIFDPYFTTKEKGHGLGLAVSFSIISRHSGTIECISQDNQGTIFTVFLPATDEEPDSQKLETEDLPPGNDSVLIMDDDTSIQAVLAQMFRHLGYMVTITGRGEDAITEYEKSFNEGNPYGLVIMDLTIPGGMGGKEAVKTILEIDPDAKVVVSSGYSNDPVMANFQEYGFSAVLTKPYVFSDLKELIASLSQK